MIRLKNTFQFGLLALAFLTGIADAAGVAAASEPGASPATRPDPEGQATRVSLGIFVVDISEIDDAKQTFNADLYVTLQWKDPRLASPEARRRMPLANVWHPGFQFINRRNLDHLLPEVVSIDQQGHVEYAQRFQGTFAVHLNLRKFPLDNQELALWIVSPGNSSKEIEVICDERSGRAQEFSITDWAIGSPMGHMDALVTPAGRELAGFKCTLAARRLPGAYIYQFVIPLTFIVCMSWAPFWMSPDQFGPRQGIAVTSILTIIAYRFVLVNQLPRVPYLTRLDYLMLGCTTLVFLVLVQLVTTNAMMTKAHPERARKLDVWARCVFPALFLILVIGVFVF
jgi:Neurotransmitter-gated ion-channel ligand binding domain/Neurotransmitter-gated ion-channel transmembrane region